MKPSGWNGWLADQAATAGRELAYTRDAVLARARVAAGERLLDLGTGRGLIPLAAAERVGPTGHVVGCDLDAECLASLRAAAQAAGLGDRVVGVQADAVALPLGDEMVDVVTTRSALQFVADRPAALREAVRVLRSGGRASFFEPLNSYLTPHHKLVDLAPLGPLGEEVARLFDAVYADPTEPMLGFDERDLARQMEEAGFGNVSMNLVVRWDELSFTAESALQRLTARGAADRPSVLELIQLALGSDAADQYGAWWCQAAADRPIAERRGSVFVWATKPL